MVELGFYQLGLLVRELGLEGSYQLTSQTAPWRQRWEGNATAAVVLGDRASLHLPWVFTEAPRLGTASAEMPRGMLSRERAGGNVGQLHGCWNERAA